MALETFVCGDWILLLFLVSSLVGLEVWMDGWDCPGII